MSTNKRAAELLHRAADRLEQPNAWCQKAMAMDGNAFAVAPRQTEACQWCSMGAITAETLDAYGVYRAEKALAKAIGTPLIACWNDAETRTQAEVVAAFRSAAKQVVA